MKKLVLLLGAMILALMNSCDGKVDPDQAGDAKVTTGEMLSCTGTTAYLSCSIELPEGRELNRDCFAYMLVSDKDNPQLPSTSGSIAFFPGKTDYLVHDDVACSLVLRDADGICTANFTGLLPSTKYYYTVVLVMADGSGNPSQLVYGKVKNFSTLDDTTTPVITGKVVEKSASTAVISCYANTPGGFGLEPDYKVFIVLSESVNPFADDPQKQCQEARKQANGTYTAEFKNLMAGTEYYYAAVMEVYDDGDVETLYGEVKSFLTPGGAMIVTGKADYVTDRTATLRCTATVPEGMRLPLVTGAPGDYLAYMLVSDKSDIVYTDAESALNGIIRKTLLFAGNDAYVEVTGLRPNTQYYYCAVLVYIDQETKNTKVYYGGVQSFKTEANTSKDLVVEATDVTCRSITFSAQYLGSEELDVLQTGSIYYTTRPATTVEEIRSGDHAGYGNVDVDSEGRFSAQIGGLSPCEKFYFYAEINIKGKTIYSDVAVGQTTEFTSNTNGHEYLDLGLSVYWAVCNVGASSREEPGTLFRWGETEPYDPNKEYKWYDHWDSEKQHEVYSKYVLSEEMGDVVDNLAFLESCDDAASVNMGGDWRMPTEAEYRELTQLLRMSMKRIYNDNGAVVAMQFSSYDGQDIYFPTTHFSGGYYMISDTPKYLDVPSFFFTRNNWGVSGWYQRDYYFAVRGVIE